MSETIRITRAQLARGISALTGKRHRFQLIHEIECVRLLGLFFETNKCFLLPGTLDLLKLAARQYERHPDGQVVVFGHTDTTGEAAVNDPLSQQRADVVAAYLKDDVDAWLAMFESSVPAHQRWGSNEDFLMLSRMNGFSSRPRDKKPVVWFQESRGLSPDGIAGPITRRQLITEYMAVDGTTLPATTTLTAIGCGERFPLDESGQVIDPNPAQNKADQLDRRVEVFFVDVLAQSAPDAARDAYPEWLARSTAIAEGDAGSTIRFVRLRILRAGVPLDGQEYTLSSPKAVLSGGTLTSDGRLEAVIPSGVGEVTVEIPSAGFVRTFNVRKTPFPEASTLEGAQLRLAQLGYYLGTIDGEDNAVFGDALAAFCRDHGIADAADDATVGDKLREIYGS